MTFLAHVTKVRTLTVTRRVRVLARSGQILTPVGQDVGPAQIVARGPMPSAYMVLRASEALKVSPDRLAEYLLVEEGQTLERGVPLLRKPQRFGQPRTLSSPADGTLVSVRDGCLILQRDGKDEELRAMVTGQVVSIVPDRGVVIEAVGSLVQAVWDSGKSAVGRLQRAVADADKPLAVEDVGPEAAGAVYVAGSVHDAAVLESLEERGARGLVTGSMPAALCGMARTLSFPVMLTEGAGRRPMAEPIFELLHRSEGREVSLLAASRAHRPQPAEIVIPLPTSGPLPQIEVSDDVLQTGSLVRVNGAGDQTLLGRVAKMHAQPRKTAFAGMAAGADVVLADGSAIFVPYANLDLIG